MDDDKNDQTNSVRVIDSQNELLNEGILFLMEYHYCLHLEPPKSFGQLVWHYICLIVGTIVKIFKAICQLVVILYQFLCLLYEYPNCMGYAVGITCNSLMTCYKNGLWDPFSKNPQNLAVKKPHLPSKGSFLLLC